MDKYKSYIFVLVFSLLFVECFAQTTISLQSVIEYGLNESVTIKQSSLLIQSQQKQSQSIKSRYFPKIDLFGSYSYLGEPLEIDLQDVRTSMIQGLSTQYVRGEDRLQQEITGQGLTDAQKKVLYSANYTALDNLYPDFNATLSEQSYFIGALALRQPIYTGGKINIASRIGDLAFQSSQIRHEQVKLEKEFAIIGSYLQIALLNSVVEYRKRNKEILENHLQQTQKMVESELLPNFELLFLELELSKSESRYNTDVIRRKDAYHTLKVISGIPLDSNIVIRDTLIHLPQMVNRVQQTGNTPEKNQAYQLLQQQGTLFKEQKNLATSTFLPQLYGVGAFNFYQKNLPATLPEWFVGVELRMNLFNGFADKHRLDATEIMVEQHAANIDDIGQKISLEMLLSKSRVNTLNSEYLNQVKNVNLAKAHTNNVRIRFMNSLSTSKALGDAEILLDETEMARLYTLYAWHLQIGEYYFLNGNLHDYLQHLTIYDGN